MKTLFIFLLSLMTLPLLAQGDFIFVEQSDFDKKGIHVFGDSIGLHEPSEIDTIITDFKASNDTLFVFREWEEGFTISCAVLGCNCNKTPIQKDRLAFSLVNGVMKVVRRDLGRLTTKEGEVWKF